MKRRQFLSGIRNGALVTVALPWLEIFSARAAHADNGFPKRLLTFFWGNGNRPESWTPIGEGVEDNWLLSECLTPLIPFKEKLAVISGMSIKVPNIMPHSSGLVGLMTGQAALGDESNWTVATESIDQLIANEIGNDTVYKSLICGCATNQSTSWNGPNARNPVDAEPISFYTRLFGPTFFEPGETPIIDPKLGYRRSVLDSVMSDINGLNDRMGVEDRVRLERHLDGVRDLEQRLARLEEDPPSYDSCSRPDEPESDYPEIDGRPQLSERNAVMSQMMAMALACDQTRVINYTLTPQLNNHLFPNTDNGHHNLTHHEPGSQPMVKNVTTQCITELAVLMNALSEVSEGDGTLLDNTCLMAFSEVSEGRTHSLDEIPLIIAGQGAGLNTNLHYRSFTQENINKAMISVIRGMGVNIASYGEGDSYSENGLSDLES